MPSNVCGSYVKVPCLSFLFVARQRPFPSAGRHPILRSVYEQSDSYEAKMGPSCVVLPNFCQFSTLGNEYERMSRVVSPRQCVASHDQDDCDYFAHRANYPVQSTDSSITAHNVLKLPERSPHGHAPLSKSAIACSGCDQIQLYVPWESPSTSMFQH